MAFPGDYTKYQEVTIGNTLVGAVLTDYPLYIDLSDMDTATDIFDTCRTDGGDIRVTLSNGTTQLAREVVSIDTTAKAGELYVKIPSLSSSVDTVIRVYYNGVDAEPASDALYGSENTWNSGLNTVLHLNDTTTSTASDSTANGNTGDKTAANEPIEVDGKIGKAQDFDGSDDQIDLDTVSVDYPFTLSAWFKADTTDADVIISVGTQTEAFYHALILRSDVLAARSFAPGSYNAEVAFTDTTSWHKAVGVWVDEENRSLYLDGAFQAFNDTTATTFTLDRARIGVTADGTPFGPFNGMIDEARVYDVALSANWISTEYNNQNSPSTFYSVSNEIGGTGVTVNCTAGSVSIASQNPDISAVVNIEVTIGSLNVSGLNPNVAIGTNIDSTLGFVSIHGFNSSISAGVNIDATLSQVDINGFNAGITTDLTIFTNTGLMAVSGASPDISVGTNISVNTGAIGIAGFSASVALDLIINANTGIIAVSGENPSISSATAINTTHGLIGISGLKTNIVLPVDIDATGVNIGVIGFNASIGTALLVSATLGYVELSGLNPTVQTGEFILSPLERTYYVPFENRIFCVPYENRTYNIT